MTDLDLDRLERVALAATQGEWAWKKDKIVSGDQYVMFAAPVGYDNSELLAETEDVVHLLAFQPRVALELVGQVKQLRALLREALDSWEGWPGPGEDPRIDAIRKEAGL